MMSWLNDAASCTSSQQERYTRAFEDPKYLAYLAGDFDLGNVDDVCDGAVSSAAQLEMYAEEIGKLKGRLFEEKEQNKKLDESRLKLEFELATQDQVIEELEWKMDQLKSVALGSSILAVALAVAMVFFN